MYVGPVLVLIDVAVVVFELESFLVVSWLVA